MIEEKVPKVFVSYSWTQEEFVLKLSRQLVSDGVDVILDKWDLKTGQDKYNFMERCIKDDNVEKVLIVSDKSYADKANLRIGGVGDETLIISHEIYGKMDQKRVIPIVVEKDESGEAYLPIYLKSRIYVDLSNESTRENGYIQLLGDIFDKSAFEKPPLGMKPNWLDKNESGSTLKSSTMKVKKPQKVDGEFLDALFDDMETQPDNIWGYPDQELLCPVTKGDVIMIGGKTNSKKSAYVHHIVNWNMKNQKVTYVSMKDSSKSIMQALIAENSIINLAKLKSGCLTEADWQSIACGLSGINENSLKIYSAVEANISYKDILTIVEEGDANLVVIDDLNGLLIDDSFSVDKFLYKLKWAAGNNGTIVIIVYNMTIPENRMDQRPMLEDFPNECYYRLCDIVHLLHCYFDPYDEQTHFEAIVAKGAKGNGGVINMAPIDGSNKVVPIVRNIDKE